MGGGRHYEQVAVARKTAHSISTFPWRHDVMHLPLSYLQQQLDIVGCTCTPPGARISYPKLFFCLLSWSVLEFQRAGLANCLLSFLYKPLKKNNICPAAIHQEGIRKSSMGPQCATHGFSGWFYLILLIFNCCLPDWRNIHHWWLLSEMPMHRKLHCLLF